MTTAQSRRRARRAGMRAGLVAAGSGASNLPLGPRNATWDAAAADKATRSWAGADEAPNAKYGRAFMVKQGDGTNFGDFKLGFAEPSNGALTANWGGVTAVAGVLSGARGGADITPEESAHAKGLCETYYAKAAKQYKDDSIKVPWAKGAAAADTEEASVEASSAWPISISATSVPATSGGETGTNTELKITFTGLHLVTDAEIDAISQALVAAPSMGACANCGHAYATHMPPDDNGDGTGYAMAPGACSLETCDCTGYVAPQGDKLEGAADVDVLSDEFAQRLTEALADTPIAAPEAQLPAVTPLPGSLSWEGVLMPEGHLTDDGRAFAPGSITWRELPLTLLAQTKTAEGHDGAEVAGKIDQIWRDEQTGLIHGKGTFDTSPFGQEIARMVGDGVLRGVSVDVAVQEFDQGPRSRFFDADGNWAPTDEPDQAEVETVEDLLDVLLDGDAEPSVLVVKDGRIGAATVCAFPAFADASIEIANSLIAGAVLNLAAGNPMRWTVYQQAGFRVTGCNCGAQALTAAAVGLAPLAPPAAWFEDPQLEGLTALTVDDEGRVYGHAAPWGVCHIGIPGYCQEAPRSETGYAHFLLGEVVCEDGERVPVGHITIDANHAKHGISRAATISHYDHTGTVVADVAVGEDEWGIWVAGAMRPDITEEKARAFRSATPSGDWRGGDSLELDWREVDDNLELVALLCVNVPGFPVPRSAAASVAASGEEFRVTSLSASGLAFTPVDDELRAKLTALADDDQFSALLDPEGE